MRWSPAFSLFFLATLLFAAIVAGADLDINKRQVLNNDDSDDDDPPPARQQTNSSPPTITEEEPTSTSTEPTSISTSTSSSSTTPTSTSTTSSETSTSTTSTPDKTPPPKTTPTDEKTEDKPPPKTTPPTTTPTETAVTITNTITADGTVIEETSISPLPTATPPPGLGQDGGSPGNSSGLSTSDRNIIIGVVVGVGGAIILGGIAFVAWRLRRKRAARGPSDEDDLMNAGTAVGSSTHETSTTNPSPFKSTLDQYHNPGPVNQSSNF
ncbi:hypothetical protein AJ80_03973 [Polytolypa hystricis UAMH7299]|uniref:Mid2 domain-containing protein n=1 Tax=Polytolypa hystricis (strain UAMH7299) TaxID=1447883 RepID=A0A2B7YE68_POLH7|nr:hypothetical protein AJ80_03973 [Polytolypa hystricis UAMH7299]